MALWVQNEKKQRKIEEYFSSINSMTMRIMEERNKAINHYKGCWDKLSYDEQDKKMDEWFASPLLKKKYSEKDDSKSDQSVKVYPTLKLNSGQKIQILDSEIQASWRDEHSDPFCCETKSQMDLRLPGSGSSFDTKSKSPSSSLDRTSERTYAQEEIHEQVISSSSEKDFFSTEPDFGINEKDRTSGQAAPVRGVSKFPTSEIKSFNIDDLTITRCDLDEGYTRPTGTETVEPSVDDSWGLGSGKNLISDFWKPGQPAHPKDERREEISHFNENQDQSKLKKNKSSMKNYSKESPTLPLKRVDLREKQSIACQKVVREDVSASSGYSNSHVNSPLTLDGAIYNLEVAMRQSRQTSNTDNGNVDTEDLDDFNFSDFGKFSTGLDSNYGLGNISRERESTVLDQKDVEISTGGVTSGGSNSQKSGFDFLDNW